MPDLPISNLPQATTPLDGTEEYAIVQSGVTKRISSENITDIIVATNNYLTPVSLTCQNGVNIDLTGTTNENTAMFELSWTGAQGVMVLNLPDCTTTINTNRAIRFISNGSYSTNTRSRLTPTGGQTLDGSTNYYEINKAYEGIMIWSDGSEWFIIQKKA